MQAQVLFFYSDIRMQVICATLFICITLFLFQCMWILFHISSQLSKSVIFLMLSMSISTVQHNIARLKSLSYVTAYNVFLSVSASGCIYTFDVGLLIVLLRCSSCSSPPRSRRTFSATNRETHSRLTRGQSNLTKSASRGPIPRLGVTPGGRNLYH